MIIFTGLKPLYQEQTHVVMRLGYNEAIEEQSGLLTLLDGERIAYSFVVGEKPTVVTHDRWFWSSDIESCKHHLSMDQSIPDDAVVVEDGSRPPCNFVATWYEILIP